MPQLLFLFLFFLPHATFFATDAVAGGGGGDGRCDHQCGSKSAPYPFGFYGDCPILLSCNATTSTPLFPTHSGTAAAPYPIVSFNSTTSTFVVSLPPSCGRTLAEANASLNNVASRDGAAGYGVSSLTGFFLRGRCTSGATTPRAFNCSAPVEITAQLPQAARCGNDTAWTCVGSPPTMTNITAAAGNSKERAGQFLDWGDMKAAGCEDVLTAAVYGITPAGVPSLEFGVAELGWWLNGTCANATGGVGQCAHYTTCHDVVTPTGAVGHRCACRDGMLGDGFAAGEGCHYRAERSKKKILIAVAGVVAGGVAAAAVALLLCWVRCRRCKAGRSSSSERLAAMRLLSEAATSSGVPVYSYAEVARATNSFSHTHRLGTGAYGTVYVGKLPAASSAPAALVAIKRLRSRRHDDDDGDAAAAALLLNEIKLISSVSHPNLVRLLGCCLDRGEQILVYEYVPNGTLSQHLLDGGGGSRLTWRARLGVAAETAAAIAYLHGMRPPIFHRDVKSSNILLDVDLRPKLADFGLSRAAGDADASRSHVSTAPQGTPGYVDPEYHQSFHLSDKSDVYSFGVVLLELITAMKVVDRAVPAKTETLYKIIE